ncbi:MAG: sigma-70 family RNA polymerase sigma factor [Kiritimatiellae bacterium]|nr:sigma-70 family RNA polymerase sigma factor [Kiritimatiellia bacterium]
MDEEAEWLDAARRGDVDAFTELVRLHQSRVRAYVASHVRDKTIVDDIAQEAFIAAYRTLDTYRGDSPLSTWLIGIARYRVLRYQRAWMRRSRHEAAPLDEALAEWRMAEAEQAGAAREDVRITALLECVEELPREQARLLTQHYVEGRKTHEIADALKKNASTVRVTLMRIRTALRQCIDRRLALEPV